MDLEMTEGDTLCLNHTYHSFIEIYACDSNWTYFLRPEDEGYFEGHMVLQAQKGIYCLDEFEYIEPGQYYGMSALFSKTLRASLKVYSLDDGAQGGGVETNQTDVSSGTNSLCSSLMFCF